MGKPLKYYRRMLCLMLMASLIFTTMYIKQFIDREIPDEISVFSGEEIVIRSRLPISYELPEDILEVAALSENHMVKNYQVQTKLFGWIPAKEVKVSIIEKKKVIPCGFQIGIYLHTEGVMIIGTDEVIDENGMKCCPAEHIVQPDDYIVSLNDIPVSTKSQLIFLLNKYGSEEIVLGLKRKDQLLHVRVKPVCTGEGQYKAGIWVRDDSQGIGTLTYVTQDGIFAGLGHGIADVDTGRLLSSQNGILYDADIWGIKKGEKGNPGGLLGSITYEEQHELGRITGNTNYGIFGHANAKLMEKCQAETVDIALKQEIEPGPAIVRCYMQGELKDYEIEIEKVNYTDNTKDKGMVIRITDEELLACTNGIVQGMSGSPILQKGKLIGAVTHVFVDDPHRGYGIFIETMLNS